MSEHHNNITGATFQINNAKLYVLVVTLSINDNVTFLENIRQGFKRTISWNKIDLKYQHNQKNINLDYLIDPAIRSINRLFVLLFKNGNNYPTRDCFNKFYFDQPLKNKQEACEKLIEMLKNDTYTILFFVSP